MTMVIPTLRYHDAPKAITWLRDGFGFTQGVVVTNEDGTIEHAEMSFGDGWIILGSARPHYAWDVPAGYGSVYIVLEDVDAHASRAKDAGAEILYGPEDTGYGSREYGAKDFEGNVWIFGTYAPRMP
jgi:uncharacterized glyoxalase superfamily protein PhnB